MKKLYLKSEKPMPSEEEIRKQEQDFRKEVELNRDNATAHFNLGVFLYHILKKYDEAEKELKLAIGLRVVQMAPAHFFLASILKELNRPDEAEKEFRKAIELKRDEAGFHTIFGIFLHEQQRLDEAERELREAIRLKPTEKKEEALAHCILGYFLATLKRYDEAEKEIRVAISLDPNFPINNALLAEILTTYADSTDEEELYREALDELNAGIGLASKSTDIPSALQAVFYNLRGYIYTKLKELVKAKSEFERAIGLDPDNFKAKRNLRRIKREMEKQKISRWLARIYFFFFIVLSGLAFGTVLLFLFHLFKANFDIKQVDLLVFGTAFAFFFILSTIAAFLPQITKLKVGKLELEKEVISTQIISSLFQKMEK